MKQKLVEFNVILVKPRGIGCVFDRTVMARSRGEAARKCFADARRAGEIKKQPCTDYGTGGWVNVLIGSKNEHVGSPAPWHQNISDILRRKRAA